MAVRMPAQGPESDSGGKKMHLMDHQDLTRGDGTSEATRMISIRCPVELHEEAKRFARENHLSVTTLIIQGLNWRLDQDY